ncbi:N-terminal double-transmembrane domain-containing protein [Rhizobiales bacterium GAS113]|nr:N-terminal double-transmembrane domain-containing protein [Rhizobiales bacterium GAS113]
MAAFASLIFSAPLVLLALLALPLLWLILRVTPPQPREIRFPPLRIAADLVPAEESPARTPWWLLLLRLAVAACVILALAGPSFDGSNRAGAVSHPLLVVIDGGWSAAPDWADRIAAAQDAISRAGRADQPVAVVSTAEPPRELTLEPQDAALSRLQALAPAPFLPDRSLLAPALDRFFAKARDAQVVWISDGVELAGDPHAATLAEALRGREVTLIRAATAAPLALAGATHDAKGLTVTVVRAGRSAGDKSTLKAFDAKGRVMGETPFAFADNEARQAKSVFDMPTQLLNEIARVEVAGERSAGAVLLLDNASHRERVGVITGETADVAQPLLSPAHYVVEALSPYADVREMRTVPATAVPRLIEQGANVLVLADIGGLDAETRGRLEKFLADGGVIIRFAGTRLAAAPADELTPVRLRGGGRLLGGVLSWDTPKTLAPFPADSPFAGLKTPDEISIQRQLLAEQDGALSRKTWAALADGTPIVTAERRGAGTLVLVHVTADPAWSNLPLSGLFVDMLRRVVDLAAFAAPGEAAGNLPAEARPLQVLDGYGVMQNAAASVPPLPRLRKPRADAATPPGLYGEVSAPVALNALAAGDMLAPIAVALPGMTQVTLSAPRATDLRGALLLTAFALFLADALATAWLMGAFASIDRLAGRTAAILLMAGLAGLATLPPWKALAADRPAASVEAALVTRLAYVLTGDSRVDEASRQGLASLGVALRGRTAFEPGPPAAIDLDHDELAFYPLIYWPMVADRPRPSAAAIRNLDTFMKNGGTVVFDTRDALVERPDGPPTPEGLALRQILETVEVPPLEVVPHDHVITKSFYLIEDFPGRYDSGRTWIEALPPSPIDGAKPVRAGDNVSPIIITSNDLAAGWASGLTGDALYPLVPGGRRQHEFALRGGINLVMYALTGNYKADQVHAPALLERLGQ